MRGRKPIPTALKKARGNPGKRKLPTNEPIMPVAAPSPPPPELTDAIARAEWRRLEPLLRQTKVLADADRGALVALCQQWSQYLRAHARIDDAGLVVEAANGNPMSNPYVTIAAKALAACTKLWAELGLTPSARSRVTATAETSVPVDPLEAALDSRVTH